MTTCTTRHQTLKGLVPFTLILVTLATVASSADKKHDFERWEKAIAAFEKADAKSLPPKNGLSCENRAKDRSL